MAKKKIIIEKADMLKAIERTWKAFLKYGPVDDGRPEGEEFEEALTELKAISSLYKKSPPDLHRIDREGDVCHHCDYEEGLDYGDIDGVESGDLEQTVSCPSCEEKWIDVFVLAEQRELFKERDNG